MMPRAGPDDRHAQGKPDDPTMPYTLMDEKANLESRTAACPGGTGAKT
nr:hypothetical protein GCM10020241_04630 [Streptoalloteichus tenebrarius]